MTEEEKALMKRLGITVEQKSVYAQRVINTSTSKTL